MMLELGRNYTKSLRILATRTMTRSPFEDSLQLLFITNTIRKFNTTRSTVPQSQLPKTLTSSTRCLVQVRVGSLDDIGALFYY